MEYKLFKIGQVAKLLEITIRTITFYIEKKLIIPAQTPESPGKLNKFSEANIYEILLIRELTQHGFDLKTIKHIMDSARDKRLITKGLEIMVIYDGHTDKGNLTFAGTKVDGTYRLKMKGRKSATVIDLSGLREKAKELAQ